MAAPNTPAHKPLGWGSGRSVAELLGISMRRLRELASAGTVPHAKQGAGYDVEACIKGYIESLRKDRRKPGKGSAQEQLWQVKTERELFELEKARGDMIERADVVDAIQACSSVLVSGLDGLGGRVAHKLARTTKAGEVRRILLDETRRIRQAASTRLLALGGARLGGKSKAAAKS